MRFFLTLLTLSIHFSLSAIENPSIILNKCKIDSIENQKVIHLKGSPYEIGYQHGSLMQNEIAENVSRFITPLFYAKTLPPIVTHFLEFVPRIMPHIPRALREEMHGIADASNQPFNIILLMNLFPEMFHCSGITVKGKASIDGELYHVRVLDYSRGQGLQSTAVLAVVQPDEGIPFLNATYAGFVGCITGMNANKIAIGEIGGKGYGYWDGVPMAFLLRIILQQASTLDEIKSTLENTARTCEYFYVFSDGKTGESLGCYATPSILSYFYPGETYKKFAPLPNAFGPPLLTPQDNQTNSNDFFEQPEDILMISRWDNFSLLKDRLLHDYGNIGLQSLQEVIKQPIAHPSNLHNAIFAPAKLDLWISHAGTHNEPACDQPYTHFNLQNLLEETCVNH